MRCSHSQGVPGPVPNAVSDAALNKVPSAPQTMSASTGQSPLQTIFLNARATLVSDAILRAKAGGYTVYTTTLRAAWEAAIDSINDALGDYVSASSRHESRIQADTDYRTDRRFAGLRRVAQYHRTLGVTLQMYIGLFKMFRDLYTEHHDRGHPSRVGVPDISQNNELHRCERQQLKLFFDEAEISMMASWSETGESVRIKELQRKALSASLEKDKYLAIFESLRDPAFLLDHNRVLINANQMANVLFRANASPGDIYYNRQQQHRALQRVLEQAGNAARQNSVVQASPDSAQPASGAADHLWLDTLHGERCFDIRERHIQDACENKAVGYVVILHDVTAHRRATEQAIKAEQQKSAFLATMSHEIRTPMHGILGATELLRKADRNKRDDYINTIESAGQHLLETLTNVLDYSRLESGKKPVNATSNHLPDFIDKLERFSRTWAQQASRELCVVLQSELPRHALFDKGSTQQILHNLVANAISHGEGSITISIGCGKQTETGVDTLVFDVSDQGTRLFNTDLSRLFEPFYQGRSEASGTGLGLAICRHLAESMGGTIDIRTCAEHGGSSRFRLQLPLGEERPTQATADRPPQATAQRTRKGNVMLVDDDPVSARITADHLQTWGVHVDRFHSPDECLHALQQSCTDHLSRTWQYFVVDYQLPGTNGAVLARRIRSMADTRVSRIVALTANTQLAHEDDGKAFDLIITKPASALDLLQALFDEPHDHPVHLDNTIDQHPFNRLPRESIQIVVRTFLQHWSDRLPGFFADLATMDNPDAVQRQAHHLASSASSVGLVEVTEDLRQLESELTKHAAGVSGRYWLDRLELPMRRAPIAVRAMAERMTSDPWHYPCTESQPTCGQWSSA